MDSMLRYQTIPSIKTSFINPIYKPNLPDSDSDFPIFTIATLSIIVTALLLLSYCIVVIKCCSNQHQLNLIRWFSLRCHQHDEDSFIALSPTTWQQGLDGSAIRGIPVFHYKAGEGDHRSFYGCAVCLNEFQEQDKLRILPDCGHAFHLDCIDVWLHGNANCPLCRISISGANRYANDSIIAPSSSPQGSVFYSGSLMGGDEDFFIIELRRDEPDEDVTKEVPEQRRTPRDLVATSKHKARRHGSIMGDECIDLRDQDEFSIQPIRRSFSLNSAADRQLYLTVQTTLNNKQQSEVSRSGQCNDSVRRSLCRLLSHGRGSKTTVRPFNFEI